MTDHCLSMHLGKIDLAHNKLNNDLVTRKCSTQAVKLSKFHNIYIQRVIDCFFSPRKSKGKGNELKKGHPVPPELRLIVRNWTYGFVFLCNLDLINGALLLQFPKQ